MKNKYFKPVAAFIATVGTLVACAPVNILNGITPSSSYDKMKNVAYGDAKYETLDIYRAEKLKANSPVLIFVHGGSWDRGSKNLYKFLAEGFTRSGYDVVVPNYRLYPAAKFPNFLHDNAKAVAYTNASFKDRKIVLIGHSAGAYNVLMLGLRDEYLAKAGVDRCKTIAGIIGLAAPTGIVPLDGERLIEIFPDRFTAEDAVLNNTTAPAPPIFLGHGEKDKIVYPINSTTLAEKIIARGGRAKVEVYPGLNHIDVAKVMSRHFDNDATLKADVVNFIESLSSDAAGCR